MRPEGSLGKSCIQQDPIAIPAARPPPAYSRSVAQFPVSTVRPTDSIRGGWRPDWQFRMLRSRTRAQLLWLEPLRLSSAHCDIAARSWIILLQEKRKNEHDGAERAQDPKDVHIGQCAALSMHQFVEPRNRLVVGVPGPKPRVPDFRAECMERRTIGRGIGSNVAEEDLLVILSPSGNHRGHDGSSDTAADIAHERLQCCL